MNQNENIIGYNFLLPMAGSQTYKKSETNILHFELTGQVSLIKYF